MAGRPRSRVARGRWPGDRVAGRPPGRVAPGRMAGGRVAGWPVAGWPMAGGRVTAWPR